MNIIKKIGLGFLVGISLVACVSMSASQSIVKTNDGILVGTNNMTLYTFDKDQA